MFSSRVPRSLQPNRITRALRRVREDGGPLVDLSASNPTTAGFDYSGVRLSGLSAPAALTYEPRPFGLREARQAVACDYARRGVMADPERIVLTASTSEAYSLLFKLLCEPQGDAVLVPVPSYPLFDHLTALDGIETIPYRLDYHGRWTLSADDLEAQWTERVRAVLAVSPNNPTGSVLSAGELEVLSQAAAARDAALIIDEVFADYPLRTDLAHEHGGQASCLTFRLGGLSKSAGLPQVKLGWILVEGPDDLVRDALDRLEVICDAYLSVSTPVQVAAASLIDSGASVRTQIHDRVRANYHTLLQLTSRHPAIDALVADAGWSVVLRVPSTRSEEDLVVDLVDRDRILVHPGFFFDFPHEAFIVISLLPPSPAFAEAVARVLERVDV